MYKIYVVNLDKELERHDAISKQLKDAGLIYEKFTAFDGYTILIKNSETQETFLGQSLKDKTAKIEKDSIYEITCNPNDDFPTTFNYIGSNNYIGNTASAGELGIWCSSLTILGKHHNNNYDKLVIFEDDILLKEPNFKQQFEKFLDNLPEDFDIAYVDLHHSSGSKIPIINNDYVRKFSNDFSGWGNWAVVYSKKAIKTLLSLTCYSDAIDDFLWKIIKQEESKCLNNIVKFEAYTSTIDLIDVNTEHTSTICSMGRGFWAHNDEFLNC